MTVHIINADVFEGLAKLPDESVHCVVTSPPYHGLRSYLDKDDHQKRHEIGNEPTFSEHLEVMVRVFREVRRVLRSDGVVWLNYGDGFAGTGKSGGGADGERRGLNGCGATATRGKGTWAPPTDNFKCKDLKMMPARLAIALCDDGWWVRSKVCWTKKNCMPESVKDRPTSSHEEIFLLAKSERYFYDAEAVKTPTLSLDPAHPSYRPNSVAISKQGRKEFSSKHEMTARSRPVRKRGNVNPHNGFNGKWDAMSVAEQMENGANLRNVWHLATEPFPGAHFAVMPSSIADLCIRAATSEKGCCSKCGAPWVRNVDRTNEPDPSYKGSRFDEGKTGARDGGERTQNGERFLKHANGWRPSCKCEASVAPCTVLDPFSGAGTTALVADRLGRDAIGIELNEKYVAMSEARIAKDRLLRGIQSMEDVEKANLEPLPLFAETGA